MRTFRPVLVAEEPLMTVLLYETQYELMYALARFQEYHENPVLRGTVFPRQAIQNWQADFYVRWNGCNFPPSVPEAFRLSNGRWELDVHEEYALSCMPVGSYIVGAHLGSKDLRATLLHERAHALYHDNGRYRAHINELLDDVGVQHSPAGKKLLSMGYCKEVLRDELQAYAVSGWEKLGVDPYDQLQPIFKIWSKELRLETT